MKEIIRARITIFLFTLFALLLMHLIHYGFEELDRVAGAMICGLPLGYIFIWFEPTEVGVGNIKT